MRRQDLPRDCWTVRPCNIISLATLLVVACTIGCQSTGMGKLPKIGWLANNDQPPVLDNESETPRVYPPPSAAAVPTTLGQNSGTQTAATTPAPSEVATPTLPSSPANANLAPQSPPAFTPSAPGAIEAPPGIDAPQLTKSVAEPAPPSTFVPSVESLAANNQNAPSPDVQKGLYTVKESGSVTTWDNMGPQQDDFVTTPNALAANTTPAPNNAATNLAAGGTTPAPNTAPNTAPNSSVNSNLPPAYVPQQATHVGHTEPASSHYESLASRDFAGGWQPGSTTSYASATHQVRTLSGSDAGGGVAQASAEMPMATPAPAQSIPTAPQATADSRNSDFR